MRRKNVTAILKIFDEKKRWLCGRKNVESVLLQFHHQHPSNLFVQSWQSIGDIILPKLKFTTNDIDSSNDRKKEINDDRDK